MRAQGFPCLDPSTTLRVVKLLGQTRGSRLLRRKTPKAQWLLEVERRGGGEGGGGRGDEATMQGQSHRGGARGSLPVTQRVQRT